MKSATFANVKSRIYCHDCIICIDTIQLCVPMLCTSCKWYTSFIHTHQIESKKENKKVNKSWMETVNGIENNERVVWLFGHNFYGLFAGFCLRSLPKNWIFENAWMGLVLETNCRLAMLPISPAFWTQLTSRMTSKFPTNKTNFSHPGKRN